MDVQALVIFLRHGTLKSDKMIVRKLTEIEKITGVKICSQLRIYERWRRRGFLIINEKRQGGKRKLNKEQVDYIMKS